MIMLLYKSVLQHLVEHLSWEITNEGCHGSRPRRFLKNFLKDTKSVSDFLIFTQNTEGKKYRTHAFIMRFEIINECRSRNRCDVVEYKFIFRNIWKTRHSSVKIN